MRILGLVKSPNHVCCRYRLSAYRNDFERAGHSLELCPWSAGLATRLWPERRLGHADVLVVQRKLLPRWQLARLHRIAPIVIFDFDDAIFTRDIRARKNPHCAWRAKRFQETVRGVDAVVAGNEFLREQALQCATRDVVDVIPTCVDADRYHLAQHKRKGAGVQLVWIGSSTTLRSLATGVPWLEAAGRGCPGLQLKIISDQFLDLPHLQMIPCRWTESGEADELAAADIGLSWLSRDVWSQGKCGLKVLQYMAAGLPVIANPVGIHLKLIRHGETGFLAETPEEWTSALSELTGNPSLRREMGLAGRSCVERSYDVSTGAALWLELLQRLETGTTSPTGRVIETHS
jgi:glycosyltransferase involved in cell wall biosynthesis